MHKKSLFSGILLLALAGALVVQAQEPPNMEEMMKKWEACATPGEGHKLLDQFVGSWDLLTRTWMEGLDKPPMETKGSTTVQ